jgi:hypothetical protein
MMCLLCLRQSFKMSTGRDLRGREAGIPARQSGIIKHDFYISSESEVIMCWDLLSLHWPSSAYWNSPHLLLGFLSECAPTVA